MDEKDRNRGGEDWGLNRGHAEAAFSEDLLDCFTCGKIYFSRHPISVRGLQKQAFHVCISCSETLRCSVCDKPVSAGSALVVKNIPGVSGGTLCSECKEKIFLSFRGPQKSARRGLRSWLASAFGSIWRVLRAAARFEIHFRKNND